MSGLLEVTRNMNMAIANSDTNRINESVSEFIEVVTFATADEILHMLGQVLWRDQFDMPPWARNLAYRLACLQRPDDPSLLREAAADLLCFGPDWDEIAERMKQRAADLEKK